jgi:hypothetical protein
MICTSGRIHIQLPRASYAWMHGGIIPAREWDSRMVVCCQYNTSVKASSLRSNLVDQHDTYPEVVVPANYLEPRAGVVYQAHPKYKGKLPCHIPECPGELKDGWVLRCHFQDLHHFDRVVVPKEGHLPQCKWCKMQVNPAYPQHIRTKECRVRMDQQLQRESAISLALAMRHKFALHGSVLECIKVFKYHGHLLVQDNNDAQAIGQQVRKARGVWAHVGQVLQQENVMLWVATKAILLYGSKTWNLTKSTLARLKGFHVFLGYRMAWRHQPK